MGDNSSYPPASPAKRQRNPSSQNLSNPAGPPGLGGRNRGRQGSGRFSGGGRGEGFSRDGGFHSNAPRRSGSPIASFEASRNKRNPNAAPPATKHVSNMRFADIPGLTAPTLAALAEDFGYEFATPIQKDTIQPALQGKDILARARTGTGKTLGFVIPAMELVCTNVGNRKAAHVVIVSPTRELASQISAEANVICKHHGQNFGARPKNPTFSSAPCCLATVRSPCLTIRSSRFLCFGVGVGALLLSEYGRLRQVFNFGPLAFCLMLLAHLLCLQLLPYLSSTP